MAKKKYVHAATLRRRVYNYLKDFPCEYIKKDVLSCIDRVPAADVEPVRRGKWQKIIDANGHIEGWLHEECGRQVTSKEKYCPKCGAKMEED